MGLADRIKNLVLKREGWSGRGMGLLLGAIAVLGQAPFHIWPAFILSLALLFARIQSASCNSRPMRAGFSAGLWWALGYFAAGTFWVGSAFIERGPEFIPVMPFMVAGLAFILAIFWGIAGGFQARAKLSGARAGIFFAAIFTLGYLCWHSIVLDIFGSAARNSIIIPASTYGSSRFPSNNPI